jgi:UDP-3-O-[3-hydroxymyristoyl] N-acetylglucosamine deacetylase
LETLAHADHVTSTSNATTIGVGDASVSTIEHLMAALYVFGVNNARVEIDGPEVPAMDGSAASFAGLLASAGLHEQAATQPVIEMLRTIEIADGNRRISIEPARQLHVVYAIDFEHQAIGHQRIEIEHMDRANFVQDIARARTFGFLSQVEAMREAGLARGGSLGNTIVLDDGGVVNEGGLRWPDEFVRHKVLDLIGDLSLLGAPVLGRVCVERGGHALHHRLVSQIVQTRDAWRWSVGRSRSGQSQVTEHPKIASH